jgi:hypothetical protein
VAVWGNMYFSVASAWSFEKLRPNCGAYVISSFTALAWWVHFQPWITQKESREWCQQHLNLYQKSQINPQSWAITAQALQIVPWAPWVLFRKSDARTVSYHSWVRKWEQLEINTSFMILVMILFTLIVAFSQCCLLLLNLSPIS